MDPPPTTTKFHFTHPNHPLILHSGDQHDYICNGCKTSGSGTRFGCDYSCNFNLHEYCANCPEKLISSSIHHHHPLTLFLHNANRSRLEDQICDVCQDTIDGLFYRCKDCDFDAHPLCTQLPKSLRHVIDNKHFLNLQKLPSGDCGVCQKKISSLWVYGCQICKVNIHPECMLKPYSSPPSQQSRGGCSSRGMPPPWSGVPPKFPGGGFSGEQFGNYNNYGNLGMGGHYGGYGYGYATPYEVPEHFSGYLNYALPVTSSGGGGKLGTYSMFALVARLTTGVLSTFVFGFPIF